MEFIDAMAAQTWEEEASFAIVFNGRVIGGTHLTLSDTPAHKVAGLGYGIGPAYWNHGYTTEVAEAILRYAFETAGLARVFATADANNLGSIRVMQKIGMKQEALLRKHRTYRAEHADEVHYGILASEWRESH
jgi:RimJ/RimL family protein N-acetyltransferase